MQAKLHTLRFPVLKCLIRRHHYRNSLFAASVGDPDLAFYDQTVFGAIVSLLKFLVDIGVMVMLFNRNR